MIITDVPYLSLLYEMPKVKDQVVMIYPDEDIGAAIVLGTPYSDITKPKSSGKNIVCKELPDGNHILYDQTKKLLEITAKTTVLNDVEVDQLSLEKMSFKDGTSISYDGETISIDAPVTKVKMLKADKVICTELEAETAKVKTLIVDEVTCSGEIAAQAVSATGDISAAGATFTGDVSAKKVTADNLVYKE
jgi:phage baseplate assembly protein gpV